MSPQNIYPIPALKNKTFIDAEKYRDLYRQSIQNPEEFWEKEAKKFLTWIEPWEKVLSGNFDLLDVKWFQGGKLNAAYNCLDRHLKTQANWPALIWEGDNPCHSQTLSYQDLYEQVCRFANALKGLSVTKGSKVCIYMPMLPEAIIAMLACVRIGAIHSVVFGGFSAQALKIRILDAECEIVITANEGVRGGKSIPLKKNVDAALQDCKNIRAVIIVKRTEQETIWVQGRDYWYHDLIARAEDECPCEVMDAEDPLFILYTSGSTGAPKGILHATAGYLLYAAITYKYVFDYHPHEVYWCSADIGWITGHSYVVYGPLLNGATTVIFEGVPDSPTPSRFWRIIDKHQVNIFYTSPTAIRALRKEGDQWVNSTSRKSLRLLGTVGEPINPDAWEWYYRVVGNNRCPIVDTWWQTETGGIMISPLPGATPLKPGSAAWPFFGIEVQILDDFGNALPEGQMGKLVITKPWPGMMQTVYGNKEKFAAGYFKEYPGCYLTGDQAYKDEQGYYWIAGRSDDIIKVSGHRIGTQEVESALVSHPAVSEAAVVPADDEIKGQAIYAYVTLKSGSKPSEQLKRDLIQIVRDQIGTIAAPAEIHWAEDLPKTRSGKIMRRILRKIANHDHDLGDLSTLADPQVVEALIRKLSKEKNS